MKRVFKMAAAIALSVMVSCGPTSVYEQQLSDAKAAYEASDFVTVVDKANEIIQGADKADATDLLSAAYYIMGAGQAQVQKGEEIDALAFNESILNALTLASKKEDADLANKSFEALSGNDMLAMIPQFEAAVAELKANAAEAAAVSTDNGEGDNNEADADADAENAAE